MNINYKFKPKKITNILYYSLILLGALLTIIRWISAFNSHIVVINEEINSHISNLSLSLIVYLAIGFTWTLQGIKFKDEKEHGGVDYVLSSFAKALKSNSLNFDEGLNCTQNSFI